MSRKKITISMFSLVLVAGISQVASAQPRWMKDVGRKIDKSVGTELGCGRDYVKGRVGTGVQSVKTEAGRASEGIRRAHQLNYSVSIENRSKYNIPYNFRGESQILMLNGQGRRHWGTGSPTITFRNQYGQLIKYSLSQSGTYYFSDHQGVLNLYRK